MSAADRGDQVGDHGKGRVEGGRGWVCADGSDSGDPAQDCPKRHSHDSARNVSLEAHAAEVGEHHDRQRREPHDGMREGAEEKSQ